MPKKSTKPTTTKIQKTQYVFGASDTKVKLVLVCECGRKKTLVVNPITITQRISVKTLNRRAAAYSYARPTATISVNRLEWHCEHEDEQ